MSLLQQNPQNDQQLDDAARGEEFTKGTSHVVWASIAAVVLVSIAIAVYMITGQKPPAATGQILNVWAVPHHIETSGFDASGANIPRESFDQMLIFTQMRLHNQSKYPLFLNGMSTNIMLDDGIHTSYAAPKSGYNDIFLAYPDMQVPHGPGLDANATIQPGQTIEGTMVSSFKMSKQQWDARKDLSFTIGFQYQPTLKLAPQAGVIIDR
jgi:hypothetical protein